MNHPGFLTAKIFSKQSVYQTDDDTSVYPSDKLTNAVAR